MMELLRAAKACIPCRVWLYVAFGALALALTAACGGGGDSSGATAGNEPAEVFERGAAIFTAQCAICHGGVGEGTQTGPPLVHAIYNPNHHPDFAFHNAVNNGVPQHHWVFGDMAPRPGLDEGDVDNIICYIRQLQVNEGIYEGEVPC